MGDIFHSFVHFINLLREVILETFWGCIFSPPRTYRLSSSVAEFFRALLPLLLYGRDRGAAALTDVAVGNLPLRAAPIFLSQMDG